MSRHFDRALNTHNLCAQAGDLGNGPIDATGTATSPMRARRSGLARIGWIEVTR